MKEPPWLTLARADIGVRETLGPNDSPWIRAMLAKLGASWLVGQPWCGGAVAHWMQGAGVDLPRHWYRARAWLAWGVPVLEAVGAVVVFERAGGGHVGLVAGVDQTGRLMVLSGNVSNRVGIDPFDRARVLGYRWPAGQANLYAVGKLPVIASAAAASSNEA